MIESSLENLPKLLKESGISIWPRPSNIGITLANQWLKESMKLKPMAQEALAKFLTES
jgi:hypothetical protein